MKVNFVIEPFLLLEVRSEAEVLGLSSNSMLQNFIQSLVLWLLRILLVW